MTLVRRILQRVASMVPASPAWRDASAPLCTFTFDDCPKNALENAGSLLEGAGASGTFFISGTMAAEGAAHGMVGEPELRDAVARGHEIGCHTYSHRSVFDLSTNDLLEQFRLNADAIRPACGPDSLTTFAYPFGEVSLRAKRAVATHFSAARGIRQGLNHRMIDLAELRAIPIVHRTFSITRFRALIARCRLEGSWIIFYTHDVCERPSPWGCTQSEFAEVLDTVMKSDIKIETVRAAVSRMVRR